MGGEEEAEDSRINWEASECKVCIANSGLFQIRISPYNPSMCNTGGAQGLSQVFLSDPRSLPLQVGEQGRVRSRHPEPADAGAADPGVHDSSEGRAGLHHPPAAPDHTHPPGDGAEDLWPSLHQPGIPQGGLATLLWDTERGTLPWEGGRGESSASGAARTALGSCLDTPLPPGKFIKVSLEIIGGLCAEGSKSLNFLHLKV